MDEVLEEYTISRVKSVCINDEHLNDLIDTAFFGAYEWWSQCDEIDEDGFRGWVITGQHWNEKGTITKRISRAEMAEVFGEYMIFDMISQIESESEFMAHVDLPVADAVVQRAFYGDVIFG